MRRGGRGGTRETPPPPFPRPKLHLTFLVILDTGDQWRTFLRKADSGITGYRGASL